jgi:hypothetical protein
MTRRKDRYQPRAASASQSKTLKTYACSAFSQEIRQHRRYAASDEAPASCERRGKFARRYQKNEKGTANVSGPFFVVSEVLFGQVIKPYFFASATVAAFSVSIRLSRSRSLSKPLARLAARATAPNVGRSARQRNTISVIATSVSVAFGLRNNIRFHDVSLFALNRPG